VSMWSRARRGTTRIRSKPFVNALVCVAVLAAISLGVAQANPSKGRTYHFSNCSGPAGTPKSFDATKQGKGASFHLTSGGRDFVVVAITDTSGTTLLSTPGFPQNGLPTVTCDSTSPVSGQPALVTGFFAPLG
jgi:hypothetical protein